MATSARELRQQAYDTFERYGPGGDPGLLRAAAELFTAASAATPAGDPQRGVDLDHVCIVLRVYFDVTKELWAAEQAAGAGRSALGHAIDRERAAAAATHLGIALYARHQVTDEREPLREAVHVLRRAVAECPFGADLRPAAMHHLAVALGMAYRDSENLALLAEAADVGRSACLLQGGLVLETAGGLVRDLGVLAYRTGDVRLDEEAVSWGRWALTLAARQGPHEEAAAMLGLANALQSLALLGGDLAHLREAIRLGQLAAGVEPDPVLAHLDAIVAEGFVTMLERETRRPSASGPTTAEDGSSRA